MDQNIKKTILLIDDDLVIRKVLARALEVGNYNVLMSNSVKFALDLLKKQKVDLVILDLTMPGLDGFAFLKFRYMNSTLASIPVIVLSGVKDEDDIQRAMEMGADQFIEKPFRPISILQKVRYVFTNQEKFIYKVPVSEQVEVKAHIQGIAVAQSIPGHLKIISKIRSFKNSLLEIVINDCNYIFMTQNDNVELIDGKYLTHIQAVGLENESKHLLEVWQRSIEENE